MTALAHRLHLFVGFALFAGNVGCSAAGASLSPGSNAAPTPCAQDNLTEPCTCGDGTSGRQVCASGAWQSCECAGGLGIGGPGAPSDGGGAVGSPATFPGNLRNDITFSWQSTAAPILDGSCPPGRYEGNLEGVYYSTLNPTPIGLPITNLDPPGAPSGFHFDLEPALGGETIQKVKGEVDGLADALFPFKAQIEGELNCRTGVFTGTLFDGSYSILVDGLLPQKFDGVVSSKYDKRTHTFVNGSWDVRETTAVPPGRLAPTLPHDLTRDGFGGSGDFAAAFPTNLNDPTLKSCPSNFTCGPGPLGPNKLLCNNILGTPTCLTDADCAPQFPGEGVVCLKASLFSLCLRECKK
jgi:hypothetical protein